MFVVREKKFSEEGERSAEAGAGPGRTKYLRCERITFVPMQSSLLDLDLLEDWELDWVNGYQKEVLEKVGPLLQEGSNAKSWLVRMCKPVFREKSK